MDLAPAAEMQQLRSLSLSQAGTSLDLAPLAGHPGLQVLVAPACGLKSLAALEGITSLLSIDVAGNQIEDLTPLARLRNLNFLKIQRNAVTRLDPLAGLNALYRLDATANRIQDVGPLKDLRALQYLDLADNDVRDLRPLGGLTQLQELDLDENNISNLEPLQGLVRLEILDLHSNQILNADVLDRLPLLLNVRLVDNLLSAATSGPAAGILDSMEARGVFTDPFRSSQRIASLAVNIRREGSKVRLRTSALRGLGYTVESLRGEGGWERIPESTTVGEGHEVTWDYPTVERHGIFRVRVEPWP